jgi:release factor glutamine methyltransferase
MNIKETLIEGTKQLKSFSKTASLDSKSLLCFTLDYSLEDIIRNSDMQLQPETLDQFYNLINERTKGTPIAYLTNEKEFYGRSFFVDENVLIPRADTETLIEAVLSDYKKVEQPLNMLELGAGSGCIAITLLLELNKLQALAVDISNDALKVAERNRDNYNLKDRLTLLQSDWFSNIEPKKFDVIISNPPYISHDESSLMALETKLYEPELALYAEENGLKNYKIIAENALKFLTSEGHIYLEIGFSQKDTVTQIFGSLGYKLLKSYQDLGGNDRVLCFGII